MRLYYYGAELSKAAEPLDLPDYKGWRQGAAFTPAPVYAALLTPAGCCFRFRRKRVVIPIIAAYAVGFVMFMEAVRRL